MRTILLTDLDGTLLDSHTYDWSPAREALEALAESGIPVVLCTSKTCVEVEVLRRALGHEAPFVVENGGAAYVPARCFGDEVRVGERRGAYEVIDIGLPYGTLVAILKAAGREAGLAVRGWHEMDAAEVADRCEMTIEEARLAMTREYDEPFVVTDPTEEAVGALEHAVTRRGARLTQGDRFFHVTGPHDKATAARRLLELYTQQWGPLTTIALGDALNDVAMLTLADVPIVVASPHARDVAARVPGARLTTAPGPAGWNEAVLDVLRRPATR